jgi:hypothetical protein
MLLILIPYVASRELNVALGDGRLWELLLEHRSGHQAKHNAGELVDRI